MLRCLSLCERQFDVEVLKVVVRCSKLAEDGGREHAFKERARCDRLEPPIEARLLVYERGELESFSAEYDGPHRTLGKSREHKAIEELDDFKLRLGTLNGVGEQKAVDGLIIADMIGLAQSRVITDALLVSGDADLTPGVLAAQNLGVRVHLLSMGPSEATSPYLKAEVDCKFFGYPECSVESIGDREGP